MSFYFLCANLVCMSLFIHNLTILAGSCFELLKILFSRLKSLTLYRHLTFELLIVVKLVIPIIVYLLIIYSTSQVQVTLHLVKLNRYLVKSDNLNHFVLNFSKILLGEHFVVSGVCYVFTCLYCCLVLYCTQFQDVLG